MRHFLGPAFCTWEGSRIFGTLFPGNPLAHDSSPALPTYQDRWLRALGVPLITAFEYYLTYDNIQFNGLFVYEVLSDGLKILLIWQLLRWIVTRLDGKVPWEKGLLRRLAVQLPLTCLAGIALLTSLVQLEYRFIRPYPVQHFFDFDVVIALIFLLFFNVLYVSLYFYDSYRRSKAEKEALAGRLQAISVPPPVAAPPRKPGEVVVRVGSREVVIPLEDILCLYSEEKETYLLHQDGKVYLMDASLDKLEAQLGPPVFFRANRKFILTRKIIETVRPDTYGKVAVGLKPAARLPEQITISRDKAAPFRDWLKS